MDWFLLPFVPDFKSLVATYRCELVVVSRMASYLVNGASMRFVFPIFGESILDGVYLK